MLNVLLIDIDSKIPNIALEKVALFHKCKGHTVLWDMPLAGEWADRIYVSCIFNKNKHKCFEWQDYGDKVIIGGSGFSLAVSLPPEIERIKPHINLGFTSRGCNNHCDFCIVPEKEGKFKIVNDLLDLWDGNGRSITALDNNILQDILHFAKVCHQARDKEILVDFNQGLDHRLLTPEIIDLMKSIRHREYRFAFDHPSLFPTVERALDLLEFNGLKRSFWYVLVGYNTTFAEDFERVDYLRGRGQSVFVQRYKNSRGNLFFGRWVNQPRVFKAMTFGQFVSLPRNLKYYNKYSKEIGEYLGDTMDGLIR